MIHTLRNEYLSVEINSFGAELTRLIDMEDGIEYVCPEANCHWENIAPILFPNTGLVKDGLVTIDGRQYPYLKHGFARESEFDVSLKKDDSITFRLADSKDTQKIFPFKFVLSITYLLEGRKVTVQTEIENADSKVMYCSLGFHPGFTCPIEPKEKAEDYIIEFPNKAYASRLNLVDGLVDSKTTHFWDGVFELPVKEHMFDNGSFSMTDINVKCVKLVSKKTGRYIQLDYEDYPNLILWAPRYKPISVICMEPWYGQPDRSEGEKDVSQKPHTMKIKSGETKTLCFSITCNQYYEERK